MSEVESMKYAKDIMWFDIDIGNRKMNISLKCSSSKVRQWWFFTAVLRMCEYLLSVGVMLPLMAVLSAAWIEVDPESWAQPNDVSAIVKRKLAIT